MQLQSTETRTPKIGLFGNVIIKEANKTMLICRNIIMTNVRPFLATKVALTLCGMYMHMLFLAVSLKKNNKKSLLLTGFNAITHYTVCFIVSCEWMRVRTGRVFAFLLRLVCRTNSQLGLHSPVHCLSGELHNLCSHESLSLGAAGARCL